MTFNNHVPPSMPIQLPCIPLYDIQLPFNYYMYPPSITMPMPFNYHVPPLCHSITMYPLYAYSITMYPLYDIQLPCTPFYAIQ